MRARRTMRLDRDRLGPLTPPDDEEPDMVNTECGCDQLTGDECTV